MTLKGLLDSIGLIGINDRLVNWAGGGPSIYEAANALTIKDYPLLFCSPTGTHRVEENWTTYNVAIFYVSRLIEDNSNEIDIQSTAVEVLKNVIKKIQNLDGVVAVADEYTINVFIEYQKFNDRTTGAYAQLDISILNDTTCIADKTHYFVFENEQGEILPTDSYEYRISWLTDYPAIQYSFVIQGGEIYNGYTEDNEVTVYFPVNEDKFDRRLTFIAFAEGEGEVGRLEFYQKAIDYFDLITEDNQLLRADTSAFTIEWATNIEGAFDYEVTKNGQTYMSGNTSFTEVTVPLENNTWRDMVNDFEFNISLNGQFMGTLNFSQNHAEFNIVAGGSVVLPANATANTVTLETTYPFVYYYLDCEGTAISSGVTSGTTLTVSFPENTGDSQLLYTVFFRNPHEEPLQNAEIRQNAAEQEEYYFRFVTVSGQTLGAAATAFTVSWEMDYPDPVVQYRLYDENAMIVLGNTTGTTATVTFPANTATDRKQYVFEAWNSGGGLLYGQLTFYQEGLYFNFITADGFTVPATATAVTLEYETDITPPIPYLYYSPFGNYSGDSLSNTALTVTFNENESENVYERTVKMAGKTISWYQEAATGTTHEYGYDPNKKIFAKPAGNQVFYRSSDGQALPYDATNGSAKDFDSNTIYPTSNVYQNGYGIVTFQKAIKSTGTLLENNGKLLEIVWPEGLETLNCVVNAIETQHSLESITLPSTLKRFIFPMAFNKENLQYINLPIGLKKRIAQPPLLDNTFNGDVDGLEIYYAGTVAQWNALGNTNWLYNKRSGQKVICSDGEVNA